MKYLKLPSEREILRFMTEVAKPYRFQLVEEIEPLRVDTERQVIYINKKLLIDEIIRMAKDELNWREIWRRYLIHEKAHEGHDKWKRRWGAKVESYGWLLNFLLDIVVDKVYFNHDEWYQKWLHKDIDYAYKRMKKELKEAFPDPSRRPHFLYNQAAYWVALGAKTLDEVADLYPESIDYISEMADLMSKIEKEEDLNWVMPEAKRIYFEYFN